MSFLLYPALFTEFSVMLIILLSGTSMIYVDSADINGSAGKIESMMMPGVNMTFGSSLEDARMHLDQAYMNLNEGNIKGAIIQLNMTAESISMHENEMMEMMKSMQQNTSDVKTESYR